MKQGNVELYLQHNYLYTPPPHPTGSTLEGGGPQINIF